MVVVSIEDRHADRCARQRSSRIEPAEPAADDDVCGDVDMDEDGQRAQERDERETPDSVMVRPCHRR